jgi:hypothetical protein
MVLAQFCSAHKVLPVISIEEYSVQLNVARQFWYFLYPPAYMKMVVQKLISFVCNNRHTKKNDQMSVHTICSLQEQTLSCSKWFTFPEVAVEVTAVYILCIYADNQITTKKIKYELEIATYRWNKTVHKCEIRIYTSKLKQWKGTEEIFKQ